MTPAKYDPSLLFALERCAGEASSTQGMDIWHLYEASYLKPCGVKSQLAVSGMVVMTIPANSQQIPESKSVKLYLSGLNQEVFTQQDEYLARLRRDIAAVLTLDPLHLSLQWIDLDCYQQRYRLIPGCSLEQQIRTDVWDHLSQQPTLGPNRQCLINVAYQGDIRWRECYSHSFRSLCPVTGQPDWATVYFAWQGAPLEPTRLLFYLQQFRQHKAFHENCCEQIFGDLLTTAQMPQLLVACFFARRGGIDICPIRFTPGFEMPHFATTTELVSKQNVFFPR